MAVKKVNDQTDYLSLIEPPLRKGLIWDQILICDGLKPNEILNLAINSHFRSICQSSHPTFVQDLNTSAYLSRPDNQFVDFPLSSILKPSQVSGETEKSLVQLNSAFDSSIQKSELMAALKSTLDLMNISESLSANIILAADELITNAIFNAPFVDKENSASGQTRNLDFVKMDDGKAASVFIGSDEKRVVLGCKDHYGTLNLSKLFERIKRCYESGVADNIIFSGRGEGAGIGSFMVFNVAESLYINVEEDKCTMICISFHKKMSGRQRSVLPKNLNFVIKKQGA